MLDLPLPHPLASSGAGPVLRIAAVEDLDAVVALLADDPLSRSRGDEPGGAESGYRQGFAEIEADVAAQSVGARMVQLTSDASRTAAHAFYERLGFARSHIGFKRAVPPA